MEEVVWDGVGWKKLARQGGRKTCEKRRMLKGEEKGGKMGQEKKRNVTEREVIKV